jgi:exonuclease SbcD
VVSIRFLLIADVHLDAPFAWAGPRVASMRRQALRDAFDGAMRLAVEQSVDAVLVAGDLYEHDRVTPDTIAFLRSSFERVHPIRVFLAPGNHDWYFPRSPYRRVGWSPNVHVFEAARLMPVTLEEGVTLWGAAHRAPANTDGFLDGFHGVDRGGVNLAVFHGSERNWLSAQEAGKVPHAPFDAAQIEAARFHHAFLGHFHTPKDDQWFTYPGNPDPLTFGEIGERGVVVAEVDGSGNIQRRRHSVAVTMIHDLEIDLTGCTSLQDVRDVLRDRTVRLEGCARVTLTGEVPPEVALPIEGLEDVRGNLDVLVVRSGSVRIAYDYVALSQQPTVLGRFVKDVLDSDLDEAEQERVLVTGLRALEGRDDLEVPFDED